MRTIRANRFARIALRIACVTELKGAWVLLQKQVWGGWGRGAGRESAGRRGGLNILLRVRIPIKNFMMRKGSQFSRISSQKTVLSGCPPVCRHLSRGVFCTQNVSLHSHSSTPRQPPSANPPIKETSYGMQIVLSNHG